MSCSLFDYKSYTKEKQSKDRIFMTVTLFVFGILGIPTVVSDSPLAWIIIFLILAFIFFIAIIFDLIVTVYLKRDFESKSRYLYILATNIITLIFNAINVIMMFIGLFGDFHDMFICTIVLSFVAAILNLISIFIEREDPGVTSTLIV